MHASCTDRKTVLDRYNRPILKLFMFNSDIGQVTSSTADVMEAAPVLPQLLNMFYKYYFFIADG